MFQDVKGHLVRFCVSVAAGIGSWGFPTMAQLEKIVQVIGWIGTTASALAALVSLYLAIKAMRKKTS